MTKEEKKWKLDAWSEVLATKDMGEGVVGKWQEEGDPLNDKRYFARVQAERDIPGIGVKKGDLGGWIEIWREEYPYSDPGPNGDAGTTSKFFADEENNLTEKDNDGWRESPVVEADICHASLSQSGSCWIKPTAYLLRSGKISGNAVAGEDEGNDGKVVVGGTMKDDSQAVGNARVLSGTMEGKAKVKDSAKIGTWSVHKSPHFVFPKTGEAAKKNNKKSKAFLDSFYTTHRLWKMPGTEALHKIDTEKYKPSEEISKDSLPLISGNASIEGESKIFGGHVDGRAVIKDSYVMQGGVVKDDAVVKNNAIISSDSIVEGDGKVDGKISLVNTHVDGGKVAVIESAEHGYRGLENSTIKGDLIYKLQDGEEFKETMRLRFNGYLNELEDWQISTNQKPNEAGEKLIPVFIKEGGNAVMDYNTTEVKLPRYDLDERFYTKEGEETMGIIVEGEVDFIRDNVFVYAPTYIGKNASLKDVSINYSLFCEGSAENLSIKKGFGHGIIHIGEGTYAKPANEYEGGEKEFLNYSLQAGEGERIVEEQPLAGEYMEEWFIKDAIKKNEIDFIKPTGFICGALTAQSCFSEPCQIIVKKGSRFCAAKHRPKFLPDNRSKAEVETFFSKLRKKLIAK